MCVFPGICLFHLSCWVYCHKVIYVLPYYPYFLWDLGWYPLFQSWCWWFCLWSYWSFQRTTVWFQWLTSFLYCCLLSVYFGIKYVLLFLVIFSFDPWLNIEGLFIWKHFGFFQIFCCWFLVQLPCQRPFFDLFWFFHIHWGLLYCPENNGSWWTFCVHL